ncbi:MAG: ABC transporter permease [Candidatus Brocadiae bacterium]|nr:ABC transporter permease [Candidatus Brocadiia bacterium]
MEKIPLQEITPQKYPDLFEKVGIESEQIEISAIEKVSFWTIVWQQFRKNKTGMFGLYCITLLVLLAIFAPAITLDKPFYCSIQDEGIYFPWFKSLFDRNFFENGVDIFFNLLMLLTPLYLLAFHLIRKKMGKAFYLHIVKIFLCFVLVHLVLFGIVNFGYRYGIEPSYYNELMQKTGITPLFQIDHAEIAFTDNVPVPDALRAELLRKKYPLSENAVFKVLEMNKAWEIQEAQKSKYSLRLQGDKLNVYQNILQSKGKSFSYLFPFRRYGYRETDITEMNPRPPSNQFPLGTNREGHDLIARMLYGTRISLTIGVVAVSIYITIGIILGASAGFFGGKVDLCISRFIEIMICFPSFFLILTLAAFVDKPSIFHIMIIIGVTHWTTVARLVRGEFLRLRGIDYVQAAIALGLNKSRIIFSHVLPNALGPVLVTATFGVASSILTESTLSFLGLGDPSAPSWGVILSQGRVLGKMWLILTPGLAIFFIVSVFNLVGEGLRDALDPKLRQ